MFSYELKDTNNPGSFPQVFYDAFCSFLKEYVPWIWVCMPLSQESECTWNSLVRVTICEMEFFQPQPEFCWCGSGEWRRSWSRIQETNNQLVTLCRRSSTFKSVWGTQTSWMVDHASTSECVCVCLCAIIWGDAQSFHVALSPKTRCAAVIDRVCGNLMVRILPSRSRAVSVDVKWSIPGHFRQTDRLSQLSFLLCESILLQKMKEKLANNMSRS